MDDFFYVVILLLLKHVHLEPFTSVKIVNNTVLHVTCLLASLASRSQRIFEESLKDSPLIPHLQRPLFRQWWILTWHYCHTVLKTKTKQTTDGCVAVAIHGHQPSTRPNAQNVWNSAPRSTLVPCFTRWTTHLCLTHWNIGLYLHVGQPSTDP